MEVFPAHLDRRFVKIIKIITVFGFPILGPILESIVGPIGPHCGVWGRKMGRNHDGEVPRARLPAFRGGVQPWARLTLIVSCQGSARKGKIGQPTKGK